MSMPSPTAVIPAAHLSRDDAVFRTGDKGIFQTNGHEHKGPQQSMKKDFGLCERDVGWVRLYRAYIAQAFNLFARQG
jgi:hypothetical protein